MHVYLKNGSQRRWLTDVALKDGFCPFIGEQNNSLAYPQVARMEPAIWSKVLVLESVSIDCDKRIVSWSTGSNEEDDNNVQNQYCINEECSGYDTEDELFDLARTVINKSTQESKESDSDNKMNILRMLHCFVLPKVTLYKTDLEKVEMAKVTQIHNIEMLDAKIKQHCMHLDVSQEELEVQRENFLPRLEDMINDQLCSRQFIDLLLDDVKHEENKTRKQIDRAQNEVESAKQQLEVDRSTDARGQLYQARESRNFLHNKLELLVTAREVLVSAQEEIPYELEVQECPIIHEYMEKREAVKKKKEDRSKFLQQKHLLFYETIQKPFSMFDSLITTLGIFERTLKKLKTTPLHVVVYYASLNDPACFDQSYIKHGKLFLNCALSVREMLDQILQDLNTQGFAEANDADLQGARATDVLQNSWYHPEWQKLSERVATIVYNPDHPVGASFEMFCSEIRKMCEDLIGLGKLSDDSCLIDYDINHFGFETSYEDELGGSNNRYSLNDFMVESYRDRLCEIKNKIFAHFDKITALLAEQFNSRDMVFHHKVRLAYEHCFYDKEHHYIECIYELAHHEHVANLETDIKRLKKLPIRLLNLPMKDEWWHEIFEQRAKIEELNSQVVRLENGTCNSNESDESYEEEDDLDGLDMEFPFHLKSHKEHLSDCISVRSFFINTVRERSRTFNADLSGDESDEDMEDGAVGSKSRPHTTSSGNYLSTSAPQNSKVSLGDLIDQWDSKEPPTRDSIKRMQSKSQSHINCPEKSQSPTPELQKDDTFEDHFGPALQNMRDIFKASSPVAKLKCLTSSLRKIADKVSELRSREGKDGFSTAVTAEDLLPLLVLMMLQLEPHEVASLWPQLAMLEDLMATFLSSGCHGWALVEFQMAQRILADLCSKF